MKAKLTLIFTLLLTLLLLASCGGKAPAELPAVSSGLDFSASPYSHLTNGGQYNRAEAEGIAANERFPYDVDAITSATLTIEGPAMKESVPLPVGSLEAHDEALVRGLYYDENGVFMYEGADLWELLNSLGESEGIIPTETAYRVVIKNSNRADIASFTMSEIQQAHEAQRPILLAYGMGTEDESTAAPFVFDGQTESEHSAGYLKELGNDDGCLRLVYDTADYGETADYQSFANAAYVYVCEESEPGYRHDGADAASPYADSSLTDYVVTFRGQTLGYEIDMTAAQLESLVQYDQAGQVIPGGIGYRDAYSLANNTYWYVNEYEGLQLYELLCYLGMPDYDTMGAKTARTTLISFLASDGVTSSESFSVDSLSYPDAFGFYNKNAADLNDGAYQSTNADLISVGYPVLLAYGFNNYPYVIGKKDEGYLSGLGNSGGPFRIIFGKTSYNHANGSNQVQYLSDVIVGGDQYYSAHKYSDDEALLALADAPLPLRLTAAGAEAGSLAEFTVGDLEDLLYGKVTANDKKKAQVKALIDGNIYEGVDLSYLVSDTLGIPYADDSSRISGSISIKGADDQLELELSANEAGRYVLAFAKNGTPLVKDAAAAGYVQERTLYPLSETDPASYAVDNCGGPVELLLRNEDGSVQQISDIQEISVAVNVSAAQLTALREQAAEEARIAENAVPNADVPWNHHLSPEYAGLLESSFEVVIANDENEWSHSFTIDELEQYTDVIFRDRYTVMDIGQCEGLDLWKFIKQLCGYDPADPAYVPAAAAGELLTAAAPVEGLSEVESITLSAPDGYEVELVSIFLRENVEKGITADDGRILPILLCYGTRGYPLVERSVDEGYVEEADNAYGPLRIITEKSSQASMKNCVKLVVKVPGSGELSFPE